jgi:pimeloyl-ACP methyl ester carboxylesterase
MLPGINDVADSFVRADFMALLAGHTGGVDVIAANTHADQYLEGSLVACLADEVVGPARARGYRRIWFLGVSLGAMGCLLFAREHPDLLEGVILLAPYLGASGTIARVLGKGGLGSWQPGEIRAPDDELALLTWLGGTWRTGLARKGCYLGYGLDDRFASSAALLAPHLPGERIVALAGAHDWPTWSKLWSGILALDPFAVRPKFAPGTDPP